MVVINYPDNFMLITLTLFHTFSIKQNISTETTKVLHDACTKFEVLTAVKIHVTVF
jgi:hypothetical protein